MTYYDLGHDLGGNPSRERSALFKSILGAAGWPGGNVSFWPMAAQTDQADTLAPDAESFWRGVFQIGAHTVLCFGRPALQVIHPQATDLVDPAASGRTTGVYFVRGFTLLALPDPADILRNGPEASTAIGRALRSLVRL